MTGEEKVKELDMVMASGWHIAREASESVYIWDSKRARKSDIL